MKIADIEFQGNRVKVILNNPKYKHFNVSINDAVFFKKDLTIGQEVFCSWDVSDLHRLQ